MILAHALIDSGLMVSMGEVRRKWDVYGQGTVDGKKMLYASAIADGPHLIKLGHHRSVAVEILEGAIVGQCDNPSEHDWDSFRRARGK
jgi:hypothetical protein